MYLMVYFTFVDPTRSLFWSYIQKGARSKQISAQICSDCHHNNEFTHTHSIYVLVDELTPEKLALNLHAKFSAGVKGEKFAAHRGSLQVAEDPHPKR